MKKSDRTNERAQLTLIIFILAIAVAVAIVKL